MHLEGVFAEIGQFWGDLHTDAIALDQERLAQFSQSAPIISQRFESSAMKPRLLFNQQKQANRKLAVVQEFKYLLIDFVIHFQRLII